MSTVPVRWATCSICHIQVKRRDLMLAVATNGDVLRLCQQCYSPRSARSKGFIPHWHTQMVRPPVMTNAIAGPATATPRGVR